MAKLTKKDVLYVASLARLRPTPVEVEKFQKQFSNVLGYMEKIKEIKTKGVDATGQKTLEINRFREDKVEPGRILSPSDALGQAKKTHNGYFVVPAVIDK